MVLGFTDETAFAGLHSWNSKRVLSETLFGRIAARFWVGLLLVALELALLFLLVRVFRWRRLWLREQFWVGHFESLAGFFLSFAHHFWSAKTRIEFGSLGGFFFSIRGGCEAKVSAVAECLIKVLSKRHI